MIKTVDIDLCFLNFMQCVRQKNNTRPLPYFFYRSLILENLHKQHIIDNNIIDFSIWVIIHKPILYGSVYFISGALANGVILRLRKFVLHLGAIVGQKKEYLGESNQKNQWGWSSACTTGINKFIDGQGM